MQPRPEPPGRPWWVVPLVGFLAFLGAVFIVRVIVGFIAGILTILVVVGLIALALYFFATKSD
jgi:hypothetical protein